MNEVIMEMNKFSETTNFEMYYPYPKVKRVKNIKHRKEKENMSNQFNILYYPPVNEFQIVINTLEEINKFIDENKSSQKNHVIDNFLI